MPDKQYVYLLTYDHGGYILWGPNFYERINSAINWLEKYPNFKIGLDNESFAYDKYSETNPEIIDKIRDMLNKYKGRFGIGASTYGQPLSVFINEESNVRQLVYAVKTNLKHFKVTPPIYAVSEHALHSQIPQLIKQAGYKGAIMRTHFMMYGYNPTYSEPFGWWVGEDGTRIPTVPTYEGEGAEFGVTTFDNWVLTRWPDQTDQSLEEFQEKFKNIKPLLGTRYDDSVLRCEKLVEHTEKHTDNFKWVLLEDLLDIYDKPQAEFHPSANEFNVRMPWGYCGNKIFNDCRKAEISVGIAERVNAAAFLLGGKSGQEDLEISWKNLLISQHHDIQICGLLSDEEKYIPKSLEYSKKVLQESLKFISTLFKTDYEHNLIVFNPLSWKSKQIVSTEISLNHGESTHGFKVLFCGESIPCEVKALDKKGDKITRAIISFEVSVDPFTANCYSIIPTDISNHLNQNISYDSQNGILKTLDYEIKINEYGICSIKNRHTHTEYVNNNTGSLFRGVINGVNSSSKGEWVVHCYNDYASLVQVGLIGSIIYEFEMIVSNLTPRIDCHVTFTHQGETIGTAREFNSFKENTNGFIHEDKLRFILRPCISKNAVGIRDLPFLIASMQDKYIQGNYWTAISDNNIGIAYFNKGAMCSVREEDGFSLPLEYANEYVWGSRYLFGKYSHEFSFYPFEGDWIKIDLHKKALEYEYPFVTYSLNTSNDGKFNNFINFAKIDASHNVLLSAFYPEDGSVIARFYEYMGKEDGTVCMTSDFANIQDEVNIMGQHENNVIGSKVHFRKHEIKSIRLKRCKM